MRFAQATNQRIDVLFDTAVLDTAAIAESDQGPQVNFRFR
jgi:hypothetical protein